MTENHTITDGITDTIPPELQTRRDREAGQRADRIRAKFLALKQKYPSLRPSRIAALVSNSEQELGDGIKTPQGVINIIKKLGLWNGTRKYTKR